MSGIHTLKAVSAGFCQSDSGDLAKLITRYLRDTVPYENRFLCVINRACRLQFYPTKNPTLSLLLSTSRKVDLHFQNVFLERL